MEIDIHDGAPERKVGIPFDEHVCMTTCRAPSQDSVQSS
jgi:hypothetical protein